MIYELWATKVSQYALSVIVDKDIVLENKRQFKTKGEETTTLRLSDLREQRFPSEDIQVHGLHRESVQCKWE